MDTLKEEHRKIAEFTRDTVFPLIDAFATAHAVRLNVESGVLVLLAQRMVYQGFQPEAVIELATQAAKLHADKPAAAQAPEGPAAIVLPFPKSR